MASFLSTAASYLGRTTLSTNYTIDNSVQPVHCGSWRISRAVRNSSSGGGTSSPVPGAAGPSTTSGAAGVAKDASAADLGAGKGVVSVWEAKIEGAKGGARQIMIDMLKKEASTLTRLRHPCILSVVEPVEETRYALTFATEPVVASLHHAVLASESAGRASAEVALDEVEIQKGLLQVARGLEFLHTAGMVHGNLDSQAVCINAKGDWKLCGFGFLTPLKQPDGTPTPYRHPDYDPSLPSSFSVNFDYLAPEYAVDEQRLPAMDMYSLGAIIYAVHSKGDPPFRNRNSVANLRSNAERLATLPDSNEWKRLGKDINSLLASLLTRYPGSRLSAQSFQQAGYFKNILVSTLKFLERESFSGRNKEERVQFLKGLLNVLPQFSDRLLRRKVLPALLELMSDRSLLPFILPNVFHIAKTLSSIEFTATVLPRLQPLFSVQDPPQNQLMLLDQIELFVAKTSPPVFREGVTPLLYSSFEAQQAMVQERALQQVPRLCEVLEYSHVKEVLFPKVAVLFSKTKILSVKVNTLISFHHMIALLDKNTLTEKLVPLLSRIKTREPSVMIATLAVHEALSKKVDRDTLAMHIIPSLWSMSMGPLLNAEQFEKFMTATREMGERVAREQLAHLKEVKRMQDHTDEYSTTRNVTSGANGTGPHRAGRGGGAGGSEMDFATLVGSGMDSGSGVARDVAAGGASASGTPSSSAFDPFAFDDLASSSPMGTLTPSRGATPSLTPSHTGSSAFSASNGRPSAKPLGSSSLNNSFSATSASGSSSSVPTLAAPPSAGPSALRPAASTTSTLNSTPSFLGVKSSTATSNRSTATPPPGWTTGSTLVPSSSASFRSMSSTSNASTPASTSGGPNYNISLAPATNFGSSSGSVSSSSSSPPTSSSGALAPSGPSVGLPPLMPQTSSLGAAPQKGPPGWGGATLEPSRKSAAGSGAGASGTNKNGNDWSGFDPFA